MPPTPAIAPAVAPERDWADDLANTLLDQIAFMPDRGRWLAIHLRIVKQEGRVDGVAQASRAVQEAFDERRGRAA